jgi:hypothetical protein
VCIERAFVGEIGVLATCQLKIYFGGFENEYKFIKDPKNAKHGAEFA